MTNIVLYVSCVLLIPCISCLYIVNSTSSTQYNAARLNWNQKENFYPASVWFCETTQDVQLTMQYISSKNIPFRVRSGRHSYDQFSQTDESV